MRRNTLLFLTLFVVLLTAATAPAAWNQGGNLLASGITSYTDLNMVADGAGGGYLAYIDWSGTVDIMVRHFDSQGNPTGTTVVPRIPGSAYPHELKAVADGAGGLSLAYYAHTDTIFSVIYNHVLADGTTPLGGGVNISGTTRGLFPGLTVAGGYGYLAWQTEGSLAAGDIYVQKFTLDGVSQWTSGGIALVNDAANQDNPLLTMGSTGYLLVAWQDERNGNEDIYAQALAPDGTIQNAAGGVAVCSNTDTQYLSTLTSNTTGGAVAGWLDYRGGVTAIYAQQLDLQGYPRWSADGVAVVTPGAWMDGRIKAAGLSNGSTGFVWVDAQSGFSNIRMQLVNSSGVLQLPTAGSQVTYLNEDLIPVVSDVLPGDFGDIFITWQQADFTENCYVERMTSYGYSALSTGSVNVGETASNQYAPLIVPDGAGGILAAWQDDRNSGGDSFYAQHVTETGYWGNPGAFLASVDDVPGDQGGAVSLNWFASYLDHMGSNILSRYTLWRSLPLGKGAVAGTVLDDPGQFRPGLEAPVYLRGSGADKTLFWEYLDEALPFGLPAYGSIQATPYDSTDVYNTPISYMVITHTYSDSVYFMSSPVDGLSVDNLAPGPVKGLRGTVTYGPSSVDLAWHPNTEADLDHYALYRGTTPGFVPDASSFVAVVSDTTYRDLAGDGSSFFRLVAVDIHGNQGPDVLLEPSGISGVGDGVPAPVLGISRIAPNPFNPMTRIEFTVRHEGRVRLEIYDLAGRKVRTLVDEVLPAGVASARWRGLDDGGSLVASGMYLVRLTDGDQAVNRSLTLVK